jgi:hypothetical protein
VVTEAPTVATPAKKAAAASLEILGGDEIIQLSIRPSPWAIALYALKPALGFVLLAGVVVIAVQGRPTFGASILLLACCLAAFGGIVAATLQWASRLYVLTNRRVMRFQGIFSVDVIEYGLAQIGETHVDRSWLEAPLRMGTIRMQPTTPEKAVIAWEHVARPDEIREILDRAIGKAKSR